MCNDRRGPKRGVTASLPICSVLPGTAQRQTPIGAQAARLRKIKPQLGRGTNNGSATVSAVAASAARKQRRERLFVAVRALASVGEQCLGHGKS